MIESTIPYRKDKDIKKLTSKSLIFKKTTCDNIRKRLTGDEFYHVNTRWFRLFKKEDITFQNELIEAVVDIQFEWVAENMKLKNPEIQLIKFGKFIIRPGRKDFLDICKSPDFDGNYEAAHKEVRRRIDERVNEKRKANFFKRNGYENLKVKLKCKS